MIAVTSWLSVLQVYPIQYENMPECVLISRVWKHTRMTLIRGNPSQIKVHSSLLRWPLPLPQAYPIVLAWIHIIYTCPYIHAPGHGYMYTYDYPAYILYIRVHIFMRRGMNICTYMITPYMVGQFITSIYNWIALPFWPADISARAFEERCSSSVSSGRFWPLIFTLQA